jgi:hypothetical protein
MSGRTFTKTSDDVPRIIDELIDDHYHDLHEVTFGTLFAHAPVNETTGEVMPPALKHHGLPAAATVRIVSLKDRAKGLPDVEILIDGDQWPKWSERRRHAVLDHELKHVEVRLEETDTGAEIVRDDLGRPKLRLLHHDVEFGAFADIAERWGDDSLDREQTRVAFDCYGQALMPWATAEPTPKQALTEVGKALGRAA